MHHKNMIYRKLKEIVVQRELLLFRWRWFRNLLFKTTLYSDSMEELKNMNRDLIAINRMLKQVNEKLIDSLDALQDKIQKLQEENNLLKEKPGFTPFHTPVEYSANNN
jgi:predicted nuclease with TOPRIM domain